MHRGKVCVLSSLEYEDWRDKNIKPVCSDHKHISEAEARDMVYPAWQKTKTQNHDPVAKVVGPHHIIITRSFSWEVVRQSYCDGQVMRVSTMQLVTN